MRLHRFKKKITIALFLLPSLLPMGLFWIYPILKNLYISFTDWDYMTPSYNFVGIKNYVALIMNDQFFNALKNTVVFAIGTILPIVIGGLLLAYCVHRCVKGQRLYQTILFSPWITPSVAISIVWLWIYNPDKGIANVILEMIHLSPLKWIESSQTAMLAVIILTVWKSIGYAMIFYLGAFHKVPKELYESARVDGAGEWKSFLKITLPLISPTTFFLIVMTTVNALQAYDQIQILTQGGPAGSTRTLLYLYYQLGFEQFQMGQAAAVAVFLVFFTVGLSLLQKCISSKYIHY